jgi:hypothetical protein
LTILFSIPTRIVEDAKRCHLFDGVSCADAVEAAIEKIRALAEGKGEWPALLRDQRNDP